MIVVKCLGEKKDVLRLNIDDAPNVHQLKSLMSEKLNVNTDCIIIKFKGKEITDDEMIAAGMKLMGFIQKDVPKTKLAPPPIENEGEGVDVRDIFDEKPEQCIGYPKTCSFYGRKDAEGYCSICYKRKKRDASSSQAESIQKKQKMSLAPPPVDADVVLQTNFEKCWICNKRIGILGFDCKCGYKFCGLHRYPEEHECSYNYKQREREQLTEKLSSYAVEQTKINRI